MTITNPTYENGAITKLLPGVTAEAERAVDPERFAELRSLQGVNGGFVADLLSDMVMHERCGRHLYRSIAGRTHNPMLQRRYEQFGQETERHIEILERLLHDLGISPAYVSPAARATEGTDAKLLESTFLLAGSVDLMTQELVMLDAVLLAETRDHANWSGLADLVDAFPDGTAREAVRLAVDQVEPEEDEHLEWARTTRKKLVSRQVKSTAMAKAATGLEKVTARIASWLE